MEVSVHGMNGDLLFAGEGEKLSVLVKKTNILHKNGDTVCLPLDWSENRYHGVLIRSLA